MDGNGRRAGARMTEREAPHLGFWMCVALVVGNIVGAGIFMLPASLASFGLNSLFAWFLSSTGAIMLAIVFSLLARAMPVGGPYAYTHAAFGPMTAFLVVWGYWISIWVANAAIATTATSYLSSLFPAFFAPTGASTACTLGLVWFFTLVSWWGVGAVGWIQVVTTVLKLLPLIAVSALGFFHVGAPELAAATAVPVSLGAVTAAATLTLYALVGLESATIPDAKIKDPVRNIPRATMLGTIVTAILYTASCTAVILLIPAATLANSNAPFADAAQLLWGAGAGRFVALCGAVSAIGCLNGWTMLQGEVPLVMARNGVFPARFAQVSARGTPTFSLVVTSALVTLLVLANAEKSMVSIFTFMILLATTASLVMYGICAVALLRLHFTGRLAGARTRTPALAVVGSLAAGYSLWALLGAGSEAVLWGAALLAAGVPVYFAVRGTPRTAPAAR
jgi:APA family basic amino acid/polyamine antiporter